MTRPPHKAAWGETPENPLSHASGGQKAEAHPSCRTLTDRGTVKGDLPHGSGAGEPVEQAGKIAVFTLLSRILGLIRDVLILAALGVGADIFFMAFRLPNIMRRMTAEGVLGMSHSASLGQKFPFLGRTEKGAGVFQQSGHKEPQNRREENGAACVTCEAARIDSVAEVMGEILGETAGKGTGNAAGKAAGKAAGNARDKFRPASLLCGTAQAGHHSSGYGPVIGYSARMAWKYGFITALVAGMLGVLAPQCVRLVAPGFDAVRLEETVYLFRWCLFYLPLAAASAIVAATLISCQRAGHAALAPVFLNIGIIFLGLGAFVAGSATFFAAGVVVGGLLQLVWLMAVLHRLGRVSGQGTDNNGFFPEGAGSEPGRCEFFPCLLLTASQAIGRWRGVFSRLSLDSVRYRLKEIGRVGMTVMVGSSGYLYFFMSAVGASFFAAGSVSAMYIAERLIEFPLAIIGSSVAMAFMPQFAVLVRDKAALRHALEKNLRLCCFVIFPAAVGIMTLHGPIVRMLFGHGAMGNEDVILAGRLFAIMGLALPALCLSRQLMGVLVTLDAAGTVHDDTGLNVIPKGNIMRRMGHTVWGGCLAILGTSVVLGPFLGLVAVAMGIVLASWGQCFVLWRMVRREISIAGIACFVRQDYGFLAALGALALGLGVLGFWLDDLYRTEFHYAGLTAVMFCCVIAGVAVGWIRGLALLGNDEGKILWAMLRSFCLGIWKRPRKET